eukprot:SAG31_NODE_700_length_12734_cov_212.705105_11_plen_208_part_00
MTTHYGVMALNEKAKRYYRDRGIKFQDILTYHPLTAEEERRLNDEYYGKSNRVGYRILYAKVRRPNGVSETGKPVYSPTRNQIQAWLAKQPAAQDFKPVERSKENRPILVSNIGDLVQADYLELVDTLRDGRHRYCLNMIDALSKYAVVRSPVTNPGKAPTAAQTLAAMREMLEEYRQKYGFYPKRLHTDNGPHFLGAFERAFCQTF